MRVVDLSLVWLKLMTFPMILWWCSFLLLWQILTRPSLIQPRSRTQAWELLVCADVI